MTEKPKDQEDPELENEEGNPQASTKEEAERSAKQSPLLFLTRSMISIQRLRVAAQVRGSHLALQKRNDPETEALRVEIEKTEEYVRGRFKHLMSQHPAHPWFSRIKGVGPENIAKVIGFIDIKRADSVSSLWRYAGFHVVDGHAPKPVPGQKLDFNKVLRSMCWRLGSSIVKSGARFGNSHFYVIFIQELDRLNAKFAAKGWKVIPAEELPVKGGKKYEPEGIISVGHVRNMAMRKMIKLFLSCLWQVWREAEGLSTRSPYAIEKLGHTTVIDPWEMVDRPGKRVRFTSKAA